MMKGSVRRFTSTGREYFHDFILSGNAEKSDAPFSLLFDDRFSELPSETIEIEQQDFNDQFEFGKYLNDKLPDSLVKAYAYDGEFWDWLSLFFFDQICPPNGKGQRKLHETARYIFTLDMRFRHYRHFVWMPYESYRRHGESSHVYLAQQLSKTADATEQLFGHQKVISCFPLVKAFSELYFDPAAGKRKYGHASYKKPGNIRRFMKITQQLEMNYDFHSMMPEEVIEMLPPEFDKWKV